MSISHAQRRPFKGLGVTWAGTVYHGLPLATVSVLAGCGGTTWPFSAGSRPEKRPDLAIALAKRLGITLKIAAKVDPVDQVYFDRDIKPLLDHPLIEFIGEIGDDDKPDFLGGARPSCFRSIGPNRSACRHDRGARVRHAR